MPKSKTLLHQLFTGDSSNAITKAEALRRAQQAVKEYPEADFSHPFYWSAFILVGNWL